MKLKIRLNSDSAEKALAQVREYEKSLKSKTERLRQRVAEEIQKLAETGFNGSVYDDILMEGTRVPNVKVVTEEKGKVSVVIAYGKEAVFAEFGAGVYYNPGGSPHPLQPPGIVEIGTYGKGYGARKVWGFLENGELRLTHGTPASMPMYRALQEVSARLEEIAREVFSQ